MSQCCPHPDRCHSESCQDACCLRISDLAVTSSDGRQLLHSVNLHIHCGQIVALIGPNGAGKSTLFKSILGLAPYTGTIDFHLSGGRSARPKVGYVPQSPAFDPGDPLTVADFFAAAIARYPVCLPLPRALRRRVEGCLDRVPGAGLANRRLGNLSGGELQRVLLALALEPLPHILILDEPLSGVDAEGAVELMDMLDELRRSYDLSILLSSHDFDSVRRYADQAVLLKGTVLDAGTPEQVLSGSAFRGVFHLGPGKEGTA